MKLIIGSHVSFNKNNQLLGSVMEALSYESNTFMFYTGSTQSTQRCLIDDEITKKAHELMLLNDIDKNNVIVHAPYIINLANNLDERKYNFYISFLRNEIERCIKLGFNKLVLHPGSSLSFSKEEAISNIAFGIDMALKEHKDFDLMIEYMSGKGTEVGTNIDDLKMLIEKTNSNISICLDTCHLNDSGIDLNNIDDFLLEFDEKIGIEKIHAIHINDSKNTVASHKDRHENIGYGMIGFETLLKVIYHEKLLGLPMILETPYINDVAPYKKEIEMIRKKEFRK